VTEQPRDDGATASRVVAAVFGLAAQLRAAVTQGLQDLDLTDPLADALWALDPDAAPVSRRVVAERLHCDPSNVTFLADRLAERGLVTRVEDPADRRVRALALTDAGREARARVHAILQDGLRAAGLDEAGQRALLALLTPGTTDPG
jgi:DNA-binding MarR family transcriptional regulator